MDTIIVSKNGLFVRSHEDRVYFSTVDNTFHLEGSDASRLANGKRPADGSVSGDVWAAYHHRTASGKEAHQRRLNPNCDQTVIATSDAKGRTVKTVAPTSPMADRQAWHAVDREVNKRHSNAKAIRNGSANIRLFDRVTVKPGVVAIGVAAYFNERSKVWVAFECDGFASE